MNSSAENGPARPSEFAQNLDLLRQVPFFSGLPLEPLKVLAYLCTRETFRPGETLFQQGDQEGAAFFVIDGQAQLSRRDEEGGETVFSDYDAGSFLGGLSLLAESRRLFTLTAETEMHCLVLTRDKFVSTMGQFPDIVPKVLEAVVKSVRDWEKQFIIDHSDLCDLCRARIGVSMV